jgi:PAS domain-containing protein
MREVPGTAGTGVAGNGTPPSHGALIAPPASYLVTDPGGVIRHADPLAVSLLGSDARYLEDVPLRTFVARADRLALRALLHPADDAAERCDGAAVRLVVPGGRHVEAELTAGAERDADGRVVGLRWRVQEWRPAGADEPLEAARTRRRVEALAAQGHGVCAIRCDGSISWANEAASELLAVPCEQLAGRSWRDLVVDAGGPGGLTALDLALRTGREGHGAFAGVRRGDGSTVALDYVAVPLHERDRVAGAALVVSERARVALA